MWPRSDAVVANRQAYRAFFLDMDFWRDLPLALQKIYFRQLYDLCLQSEHNEYNIRRLMEQGAPHIAAWLCCWKFP